MSAILCALLAVPAYGARPSLHARSTVMARRAQHAIVRNIVAVEGERSKGFGKQDPGLEARLAKKLETIRSPEQLRRMQEDADRERMDQYIIDEGLNVMPEVVGDRMLKRMIFGFGAPMAAGFVSFAAFIISARYYDMTIRPTTVAITTQAIFALGVFGITYGPLSASWDEDREGSLLGVEEVGKNIQNLIASLRGTDRPPPM
jgi:hypothetical protein